jgi:hypothetical protein
MSSSDASNCSDTPLLLPHAFHPYVINGLQFYFHIKYFRQLLSAFINCTDDPKCRLRFFENINESILRSWDVARLDGVDGAEEDEDHVVDQGHQDREGGHTTRFQSTVN